MRHLFSILLLLIVSCDISPRISKVQEINENPPQRFSMMQQSLKQYFNIKDIKLLGSVESETNTWFIIEGNISDPTYEDTGIFLYPENKDGIPDSLLKHKYSYAGEEYSPEDSLVYESRVFFGECSPLSKSSIIWYQRELKENSWDTSVFVVDLDHRIPLSGFISKSRINLEEILANVQRKVCKEIPGKVKHVEP
jgi:hypothetical protein